MVLVPLPDRLHGVAPLRFKVALVRLMVAIEELTLVVVIVPPTLKVPPVIFRVALLDFDPELVK